MIVVLGLVSWVQYARVTRGATLALRNQEFMLAARSIGAGTGRLIWRHLLPSVLPPLAVIATNYIQALDDKWFKEVLLFLIPVLPLMLWLFF
mgnify:CR=1 FL=1